MTDAFLALLAEAHGLPVPGVAELHAEYRAAPPEARGAILATLGQRIAQAGKDAATLADTRRAVAILRRQRADGGER